MCGFIRTHISKRSIWKMKYMRRGIAIVSMLRLSFVSRNDIAHTSHDDRPDRIC